MKMDRWQDKTPEQQREIMANQKTIADRWNSQNKPEESENKGQQERDLAKDLANEQDKSNEISNNQEMEQEI